MYLLAPTQTAFPDEFPKGAVLLIDKPLGWTSFDVVNKVRHHLSKRLGVKRAKVGHAGTLDPLATGLLILCVGDYTRQIDTLQAQTKVYTGTIAFGATTPSFDLEKPVDAILPTDMLSDALLEAERQQFLGEIEQIPPIFSAIKVDGKRLYKNARTGAAVEIAARKVVVDAFNLSSLRPLSGAILRDGPVALSQKGNPIWQYPDHSGAQVVDFEIVCGKGTYIRSLANDLGQAAGCGAYLSALRRTASGDFKVDDAWNLETLVAWLQA